MEIDPNNTNGANGSSSTTLRLKIEELKLANFVATQDAEKYKRECLSLREAVSRLEEDRSVLRDRELKDQETIQNLLEEIEKKQREFAEKIVELSAKRKKAEDEVQELKEKFAGHVNETAAELEKTERELTEKFVKLAERNKELQFEVSEWRKNAGEVTDKMPHRKKENGVQNAKVNEQSNSIEMGTGKLDHEFEVKIPKIEVEKDDILLSQLNKKRVREGDKKDSGSLNGFSGCVKAKTSEFGCSRVKEISAELVDERIPSGSANSTQGVSNSCSMHLYWNYQSREEEKKLSY